MVNVQILVLPNQMLCTTKRVTALMATILHHESRVKFPLNDHQQYWPNDKLAFRHF